MYHRVVLVVLLGLMIGASNGCSRPVQSVSGTKMATAGKVETGPDGLTIEQRNIKRRIEMDNQPGAIKHLYVISAYSGQVLIYSTVDGKVTSSGKRLTPTKVTSTGSNLPYITVGNDTYLVEEVLGEDGTVGSSIEYLYWWDSKGIYHQHYVTGGQLLHISNEPLVVKDIVINMEISPTSEEDK